jgi:hypothetical protein
MLVFVDIAILLKLIGKVSECHCLTNCLAFPSVYSSVPAAHHPRLQALMFPTTAGGALWKQNGP